MKLNDCIKRIENYMRSADNHIRLVNVNNCNDMNALRSHFKVGATKFIDVSDFANKDEAPSKSALLHELQNSDGCIFLTGFTSFYKLLGEQELREFLTDLISMSFGRLKLIVLCFQCKKHLNFADSRYNNWVYLVDGSNNEKTELIFCGPDNISSFDDSIALGVQNIPEKLETNSLKVLNVATNKHKSNYPYTLLNISEQAEGYELLCTLDSTSSKLLKSYGSEAQWDYAASIIKSSLSWAEYAIQNFGSVNTLDLSLLKWNSFDENQKWIYFILFKLFGSPNNQYLNYVIEITDSSDKLIKNIYNGLLKISNTDGGYWDFYNERKYLIQQLGKSESEIADYCKWVLSKGKDAVYYLTDMSDTETNKIFQILNDYCSEFEKIQLTEILKHVYPDLYLYLSGYDYNNDLLNRYFSDYKYQKVINHTSQEFLDLVEEQALKREYNLLLPCRSEKTETVNAQNSLVYFIDAMGAEYLSYIMAQCQKHNLMAFTILCHCEIPSITCKNKEFIEIFKNAGAVFAKDENGIKSLDDLKHHGEEDYDYNNNKLPTYISSELKILSDIIEKASSRLKNDEFERVILISDHGSSRLSVISGKENKHQMQTNGVHSGRCCPKSESDVKPDCAVDGDDFWVLANYDRFKGGRKANIEVHGGATLEEVVVPIIEIKRADFAYEFEITTTEIKFSKRKRNAAIQIFSKEKVDGITVKISRIDSVYAAESTDGRNFTVLMPDLKAAGDYTADIYFHNNLVKSGLKFHADNADFSEKKLL